MEQKIAIKYLNGIVVPAEFAAGHQPAATEMVTAFVAEMARFGYVPNKKLMEALSSTTAEQLSVLFNNVIPVLKEAVGAHRVHKPFYPNFPDQVMEMEESELYLNALMHYWTFGQWQPNFTVNDRPVDFESTKFKTLGAVTETDVNGVYTQILSSADSISESDKVVVEWFVDSGRDVDPPESIPFKENLCLLAGIYFARGPEYFDFDIVKDTTDILRIATYLSGGDISLAEPTKFKNLPRPTRRVLVHALENVAREEDFLRHKEKWIRLLHNLHVGDYSRNLYAMAKKLREHEKIETFRGKVEAAIESKNWDRAVSLLSSRPGEYARMLGRLLTSNKAPARRKVINGFARVVDQVPTRNLLQLWGSMKTRTEKVEKRVVFPKGSVAKAYVLRNELAKIPKTNVTNIIEMITDALNVRFGVLPDLGKVYIDPALYGCPLPTGMRSASEGLRQCARGTRMPIGDKDTLRFFIYWKGQDIDLSASLHGEDFQLESEIAYYNLKGSFGCHSGDITYAPDGASEFIDVNIEQARKKGRYLAMNVIVYSGPTFAEHEECFAGWMTRDKVNSNEIYEPKTVEQKIDLRSESKNAIPVMFDLETREAIWVDVNTNSRRFDTSQYGVSGNNVENNKATISDMMEAFTSLENKITLGELFMLHAMTRGEVVKNRSDAEFVFGMDDEADVNPFNVTVINSDYVV